MTAKLFAQAITKFLLGIVLVGLSIFLPAGTFSFLTVGYLWGFYLSRCSLQEL